MEEVIEVMRIDGSTVDFTSMADAMTEVREELRKVVKEVHGKIGYNIANINNDEYFAVNLPSDKILSPVVFVTYKMG